MAVQGLPHAGGGVSSWIVRQIIPTSSSPRRWGCFPRALAGAVLDNVFPTQVGVFLPSATSSLICSSLPHAGGGVSLGFLANGNAIESSQRRWGCFLLSTCRIKRTIVFPTQVGVFPESIDEQGQPLRLPHAGGVCFLFNRIP